VVLTGKAYLLRDILTFHHPWQHAVREAVRSGHLPLWNHDTYCGIPLLANLQSGFFYPVNWLYWFLPFDFALTLGMVFHLTIAGIGMREFLRRLDVDELPAFLGGAAFAYGTWSLSHLEFPMKLGAAVWLPFVWTGLVQAMRDGRNELPRIALAISLSLFAGYPQVTLFGLISGTLLAVCIAPGVLVDRALSWKTKVSRVAAWPAAALLAALIAAAQLLPAAEMTKFSSKVVPYDPQVAMTRSLPLKALAGFFDPFFVGFPGVDRFWGGDVAEYAFTAFYAGAGSALLAAFALATLFRPGARRREGEPIVRAEAGGLPPRHLTLFLGLGLALGIVVSLGKYTFVYSILHEHVPGFGRSRWPSTAVCLIAVHLAALAGVGAHAVLAKHESARRAGVALAVLGALLLLATLLAPGPLSDSLRKLQLGETPLFQASAYESHRAAWLGTLGPRAVLVLIAGLVPWATKNARRVGVAWTLILVLDLFLAHRSFETPNTRGFYESVPEEVRELREELAGRRLFIARSTDQLGNFLYGVRNAAAFEWAKRAMLCNANVPLGISQAQGCEPLSPRRHDAFAQAASSETTPWKLRERILDLWDAALWISAEVSPLEIAQIEDPGEKLLERRHHPQLARATLLAKWETVQEGKDVLARLFSPEHDPSRVTLVEPEAASRLAPPRLEGAPPPGETPAALALVSEAGPNSIRVTGVVPHAGMLRVLESWAPGWRAFVNGRETPVYRADFLFLALPVPRGALDVELVYRPVSVGWGFGGSLLGLLGVGVAGFVRKRGAR
jgi:hypothetical protein